MSELLKSLLTTPEPPKQAASRVGDWAFTAEYAPHDPNSAIITATSADQLRGDDDIRAFITSQGGVIPDGYRARLVEARHQTHGWTRQRDPNGEKTQAVTRPIWFYRFAIEPINGLINVDELISHVKSRRPVKQSTTTDVVFHFAAGDLQLGKMDGDGTQGIIDTYMASVAKAVDQWKAYKRPPVHIAFLGDCLEGNQSQGGRNMWRTHLTVTEQLRLFRRLILHTIDAFAAAPQITVDVVNGNHDDVQRQITTRADDGHATESAVAIAEALALNPERYGHVHVYVPGVDEDHIVRKINNTVIVMAHGHQWSRGKSLDWWKGQAFNLQPAQAGHILLHGHEHEFSIQSRRDRLVVCVPALESESTWWKHKTGDQGKRGCITFTTHDGEFANLNLV